MPQVDVPFPTSNAPGLAAGEGMGRLINCYAYKEGTGQRWRALPGLKALALTSALPAGPLRGLLLVGSLLYAVVGGQACIIGADLSVTVLGGTVSGTGPVTMARNNALVPDIVVVTNLGNLVIAKPGPNQQQTVQQYPDGTLPQCNSVDFLDGYFLFTTRDGFLWSSGLNTTTIGQATDATTGASISDPLAFAKAEARPDGLLRGVVFGPSYLAMGDDTIEVWQDAATDHYPLARVTVIPIGLYGPWAVAGTQAGWNEALIFVASDRSVRRLDGYTPTRISPVELDRLIEGIADPTTLIASVYTFGSQAIWSLSCPDWTWEYNVATNAWHERQSKSTGFARWRASLSVKTAWGWVFGDVSTADLVTLDEVGLQEVGDALTWGLDSAPVKQFPARLAVPDVFYDFVLGTAPQGVDPQVLLSWSKDGGYTWGNPLSRSLGVQGAAVGPIRLRRLGLSSHHGIMHRFRISDPVYTSFAGARMDATQRRP